MVGTLSKPRMKKNINNKHAPIGEAKMRVDRGDVAKGPRRAVLHTCRLSERG